MERKGRGCGDLAAPLRPVPMFLEINIRLLEPSLSCPPIVVTSLVLCVVTVKVFDHT
jgi:hypothetical protein